ncbi:MAG: hypothetical protein H6595_05700 [Flavobacteriales bacterium]|nr:hypothetical protein [Flavobacteriales bacterium]MCB9166959.1 hypothetical protein [Flavobacteriales bacterium]
MLARSFRTHQPAVLLLLLVIVPLLWSGAFGQAAPLYEQQAMLFYRPLAALFDLVPWSRPVSGMVLCLGIALQLNALADRAELLERRSNLPALLFPLLLCIGPEKVDVGPALFGMPLVLFALDRTWRVQERQRVQGVLFDSGLAIGAAGLFYLPYVFLLVVVWASTSVMRPFSWREYVLPAVGVVLVLYFDAALHFLFDLGSWTPARTVVAPVLTVGPVRTVPWRWIGPALMLVLFVPALLSFYRAYKRSVMREKNLRSAFLAFVLAALVIAVFGWLLNGNVPSVLIAAPLALFLAFPLTAAPRWIAEVMAYGLLAAALVAQWGGTATFAA